MSKAARGGPVPAQLAPGWAGGRVQGSCRHRKQCCGRRERADTLVCPPGLTLLCTSLSSLAQCVALSPLRGNVRERSDVMAGPLRPTPHLDSRQKICDTCVSPTLGGEAAGLVGSAHERYCSLCTCGGGGGRERSDAKAGPAALGGPALHLDLSLNICEVRPVLGRGCCGLAVSRLRAHLRRAALVKGRCQMHRPCAGQPTLEQSRC